MLNSIKIYSTGYKKENKVQYIHIQHGKSPMGAVRGRCTIFAVRNQSRYVGWNPSTNLTRRGQRP